MSLQYISSMVLQKYCKYPRFRSLKCIYKLTIYLNVFIVNIYPICLGAQQNWAVLSQYQTKQTKIILMSHNDGVKWHFLTFHLLYFHKLLTVTVPYSPRGFLTPFSWTTFTSSDGSIRPAGESFSKSVSLFHGLIFIFYFIFPLSYYTYNNTITIHTLKSYKNTSVKAAILYKLPSYLLA